ncbi:MAG: hypothetical protein KJZ78_18010, partial [Bryobacteraceae bacterium]|nr:hypothetical protein [Bryobacteraceae bacterium]
MESTVCIAVARVSNPRTAQLISAEIRTLGGMAITPSIPWWIAPYVADRTHDAAAALRLRLARHLGPDDQLVVAEILGGWSTYG